jgi:hypothetical protein
MNIKLKDERLGKRWQILVRSQMKVASPLAAGVGALPSTAQAFAATQAAWRFYNNERVELSELVVPLRNYVRERVAASTAPFVLLAHDWCKLSFPGHEFRKDLAELSNDSDIGYELTTSLAISAEDGAPLAPVEMHMRTKDAFLSTRDPAPRAVPHLEQIRPTMQASHRWNLGRPIVHVIDREADSVGHYREWDADGHKVLIRADDRRVLWQDRRVKLSDIKKELLAQGAYHAAGPALYRGRKARLEVTETTVVLHRPARKTINKKRVEVPGLPLTMRLILTRVLDEQGRLLAEWYLLSNVPPEWADAARLARCYYWRWQIESYFKLLKSHGFQLEDWLQETGLAIARRILVVSMAAVTVWQLLADESAPAQELKTVLVRLSGRQMKRHRQSTAPALLAGLWCLLSMLDTLEQYDVGALKALVTKVHLPIPLLRSG